ncbi:FtsK/SpoIIIE domain-containing protein [Micrococcaceae bacterium Sec5.7]
MTLHCTLVRGPGSRSTDEPLELTIEASPDCTGEALQTEITRYFGTRELTLDGSAVSAMTVGVPPLVNGAILVDGGTPAARPGISPKDGSPPSLMLVVRSGPGAGTMLPLQRGTYRIGRSNTEVIIPDADLSREHARLEVSDTAITIVDLDSANGTEVDGKRVRKAVVSTGSTVRCGNSTMSVIFRGALSLSGHELAEAGQSVAAPLKISRRAEAGNRTALLLSAGLPLVIGVGLAVLTGMWMFLAFTAVSAVSVLVPVVVGRRQRGELKAAIAAAVQEDRKRRRRSAPSAADLVISGPVAVTGQNINLDERGVVWLRLGLAEQQANISFEPDDPNLARPALGWAPLTLDPSTPIASVRGARRAVNGLAHSIIMQLSGYPLARNTRILIHGRIGLLPLAARYLDKVTLSANTRSTAAVLIPDPAPGNSPGVLMIMGDVGSAGPDAEIIEEARGRGWQVFHFIHAAGAASPTDIELGERTATLSTGGLRSGFVPDLVPEQVFNRYCRQRAAAADGMTPKTASLPESCSLGDVLPLSTAETSLRWATGRLRPGLPVPVGLAATGPRILDLEADGPHLLVAGTTGSGKSELLRSLTAALALSFPPDRINFLFIDFKGGSGLGPLTGLPHCVGMLTDLTLPELDRSLASLRSEIRLREELLASVQAPDLAAYRATCTGEANPLPHLILIIDEFRMLVEDAPEALRELMRIAAIGRSLGVHLIMATQRPQGALTADIRANVTTSIALRVQSEMESVDIINSKIAAGIAVDAPGRAFLARGTEAAEEFQTASLGLASAGVQETGITIRLAEDALSAPFPAKDSQSTGPATITPAEAAAPIIDLTCRLWSTMGGSSARRPVANPLPAPLPFSRRRDFAPAHPAAEVHALSLDASGAEKSCSAQLGWVDLPDEQRIALLEWRPAEHGHIGLVGGQASGAPEAMLLAVHQLITDRAETHFYILDADTSFGDIAASERVGAVACLHELRRGVRVLERLAHEMSARLSRQQGEQQTPLVLVISGWGSWVSAFRAGPLMWAEDVIQDIVRDGKKAGITVIISGERELVTSRFFASVPNRVFFPTGSNEDSRLAWPRLPDTAPVPGRGVAQGALADGKTAVCQFFAWPVNDGSAEEAPHRQPPALLEVPFRIEPLPARVLVEDVLSRLGAGIGGSMGSAAPDSCDKAPSASDSPANRRRRLYIGLGGDELDPVAVRLPAGSVLAVLGGPASGKSTLIEALPAINTSIRSWLCPASGSSPEEYWARVHAKAMSEQLDRNSVVLADDADLLPPAANQHLLELNNMGWTVIWTAGFSSTLMQSVPLALNTRSHGTGVLIAPRSLMDGDFFGLRFELEASPPAGRAILISDGRATAVQLPLSAPPSEPGLPVLRPEGATGQEVTRPSAMQSR